MAMKRYRKRFSLVGSLRGLLSLLRLKRIKLRIQRLDSILKKKEKKYAKFIGSISSAQTRSLIMAEFDVAYAEKLALRKTSPKVVNDLTLKRHVYGESKAKEFEFRMAVAEVMEDICRVNNWTTLRDFKEHKVPYQKILKDLYYSSVEYGDILKYFARLRFSERKANA